VIFVGVMNKFLYRFPSLAPAEPMEEEHNVAWGTVTEIVLSWLITVPLAALASAGLFSLLVTNLISSFPLGVIGNSTNSTNTTFTFH